MFRDASRAVKLVAAAMTTAEFDARRLEARAGDGWTTLTELADTLVRDQGLPFKTAHAISGRLIAARQRDPERPLASLLADISSELLGTPLAYSDEALARHPEPAPFRRGAADARRAGARGDGARVGGVAASPRRRTRHGGRTRPRRWRRPNARSPSGAPHCEPDSASPDAPIPIATPI